MFRKKKDKDRKKPKFKGHVGKFPVNSRITIDYTGKKPTVKFAYPSKDSSSTFRTIAVSLPAMILVFITFLFIIYNQSGEIHSDPEFCSIYPDFNYNSTTVKGINADCIIDGEPYEMSLSFSSGKKILWYLETYPSFYNTGHSQDSLILILPVLFLIPLFYIFCKFFELIYRHTHWGHKNFPELNKILGGDSRFSATFRKCPKNKQLEIPLFKNIYMDYIAEGEFSKYLQRIEIREHPFNELIRKNAFRKRKREVIKKKNIWLWKTTFYFSKQPKKGKLEIRWT